MMHYSLVLQIRLFLFVEETMTIKQSPRPLNTRSEVTSWRLVFKLIKLYLNILNQFKFDYSKYLHSLRKKKKYRTLFIEAHNVTREMKYKRL